MSVEQPVIATSRPVPKHLSRYMNEAVRRGFITGDAYQSLLNLMNPFPDEAVTPCGWPTTSGNPSVAGVVNRDAKISAPVGTVNSWNFAILQLPFTSAVSAGTYAMNQDNGNLTLPSPSSQTLKMWGVWTWKDSDPNPDPLFTPPTFTIDVDAAFPRDGEVRLCACGIEAINTSPFLSKGGQGYAFRLPSNMAPVSLTPSALPTAPQTVATATYDLPSFHPNDWIQHGNTYTGTAERGIVSVNLPARGDNPHAALWPTRLLMRNRSNGFMGIFNPTTGRGGFDWDTAGILITGLAPTATFTGRFRAFYEIIPLSGGSFTEGLARPPVARTPLWAELAAETIRTMPAGFDYGENPFGEWMSRVLAVVSDSLPNIAAVLPHPAAKAVAYGLAAGARVASDRLRPTNPPLPGPNPAAAPSSAPSNAVSHYPAAPRRLREASRPPRSRSRARRAASPEPHRGRTRSRAASLPPKARR